MGEDISKDTYLELLGVVIKNMEYLRKAATVLLETALSNSDEDGKELFVAYAQKLDV